ncbi:hypothetical protein GCK72_007369 [Caenorhabditis remanei]|uniref:BTB domain-containing protein n=1 Tax=Caenorhabditis remanei TaxID=31234 RepID=A0A6A5HH66_CAERE|nr:hypothetical protein GCK72_007369 [Caenorhabditis remanei]KAF1767410.1 hypothetical protein GCK72_007369 [Caenorhabditis remanei]
MSDTTDDANNPNNLVSKFLKLQSETNEIQSIFSKQSSFDVTSLSGNKMLKDLYESMINRENEQNKFNEELMKTMKDQNKELKLQSEQVLKEIRSIKSDLEELKNQYPSEIQSMKKLMSVPDSDDSSLLPDTLVKNDTSTSVTGKEFVLKHISKMLQKSDRVEFTAKKKNISIFHGTRMTRKSSHDFGNKNGNTKFRAHGYPKFIDWKDLEKDYIVDGKLRVEISVKITNTTGLYGKPLRNFDERNKAFSDVVIKVKEKKFHVFKLHLVAQSAYFKSLLSGISPNEEVELSGIEPEDFQVFLEVLYGEPAINEKTVEVILYLAEKYDTHAVTKKCEEFLIDGSGKKMKKKLELAIKYKLEKLKKHCFDNIVSAGEIRSVLPSDISDLDPSTMKTLLQKSLDLLE